MRSTTRWAATPETTAPPSYFYQQPYFPMLRDLQDKWTHIAELLQQGTAAGSTLVLSPASVLAVRRGCDFRVSGFPNDPAGHFRARHERPDDALAAYEVVLARTFRDLAPDCELPEGFDEVLASVRLLPDGGRLEFLVNLSGRDLPFPLHRKIPFRLYDPASRTVVFEGTDLPGGTLLRKGSVCFVEHLPALRAPSLEGGTKSVVASLEGGARLRAVGVSSSVFAPEPIWRPLGTDSIRPLGPNTLKLSLPSNESVPIDLAAGATVSAVYAEGLSLDTLRSQAATSLQGGKPTSATPPVPLEGTPFYPSCLEKGTRIDRSVSKDSRVHLHGDQPGVGSTCHLS